MADSATRRRLCGQYWRGSRRDNKSTNPQRVELRRRDRGRGCRLRPIAIIDRRIQNPAVLSRQRPAHPGKNSGAENSEPADPTAYRRVGNYSVFVFNALDEKTANALIDQVKYEQVVQWLGDDPHLEARVERYLAQTTAGVLIAVLKSSGLSLLICLGVGTLFGALLFRHRRAQQEALYSDAGGGTRLNLDELTGTHNTHRLLEAGKQPESDS